MQKTKKTFNTYFERRDLTQTELYSKAIVKSLVRSILEPIASLNSKAIVFLRLKDLEDSNSLIKRLEYSGEITLKEFSDFDFSKYDVEETGMIVLNSQRYNCAFLFREAKEGKYEIYLKINSILVNDVYRTLKSIFCINYDSEFFQYKPERRDNNVMNSAVQNLLKHFEEAIQENEYNNQIRENYKSANEANLNLRNEVYESVRQIAHEIKNQISILDIYTKIFETKSDNKDDVLPIRKSIELIKSQLDQFKNTDNTNLQEKDIKSVIQESIKMYANVLKEKNNKLIFIDEMAGQEAPSFIDEEKFSIVINNIIKNAHDSTKDDEVVLRLTKANEKIKISIVNHGEMISKENQPKIFDDGFTTKKDGWGVGLPVCKKYIASQFGSLELAKSDEKETEFLITLPLAQTR